MGDGPGPFMEGLWTLQGSPAYPQTVEQRLVVASPLQLRGTVSSYMYTYY